VGEEERRFTPGRGRARVDLELAAGRLSDMDALLARAAAPRDDVELRRRPFHLQRSMREVHALEREVTDVGTPIARPAQPPPHANAVDGEPLAVAAIHGDAFEP
jgi:hypothetical protein